MFPCLPLRFQLEYIHPSRKPIFPTAPTAPIHGMPITPKSAERQMQNFHCVFMYVFCVCMCTHMWGSGTERLRTSISQSVRGDHHRHADSTRCHKRQAGGQAVPQVDISSPSSPCGFSGSCQFGAWKAWCCSGSETGRLGFRFHPFPWYVSPHL